MVGIIPCGPYDSTHSSRMLSIHPDARARLGQKRCVKNPNALSRRGFAKLLGAGAAYAALRPTLGLSESTPKPTDPKTSDVVRLSSNENPYGPSAEIGRASCRERG